MTPAQSKVKRWREDPIYFVRDVFHVEPDGWQLEALHAFGMPYNTEATKQFQRISLQACAGPGKTAVEAWCGWHFLATQGDEGFHPNGAAVAITSDNLKDNLWKEMAVWHGRSDLLMRAFTWQKERIFCKDHPQTWFLSARSWSKNANPDEQGRTLSGLHSKYILYLIDESGDISPAVLRSAEQGLGNCVWGKIVQAGNPTSQDGMLYVAAVTQRHIWCVIRITGDPDDPQRSPRIDIEWAREQIRLWGRENPWVMSFILGQFPPGGVNSLLGIEEVQAAMGKHLKADDYNFIQKRLGIDVAREGDDRTVIFPRQGLASFIPVIMRNAKGYEVGSRVALAKKNWKSEVEFFDDTGGWAGAAIEAMQLGGYNPIPINFSGKANDPRYFNKRAEMWFEMAEWVKNGGALPNIPEIVAELTIPKYWHDNGRFRLEEKEQIKKRLGRSPDLADALALTFAWADQPASGSLQNLIELNESNKALAEYDPFAEGRI